MIDLAAIEARVVRTIHPGEQMFHGSEEQYFRVGRSALESLETILKAARKPETEARRILDLPCGHGRVLRYLRAAFPDAEIVACDLLRDGVDFCATAFGAVPVYSVDDPAQIPLPPGDFDLIWVGSLFTHLDVDMWQKFLRLFRSRLAPQGILAFSAHGRQIHHLLTTGKSQLEPYWRKSALLFKYERTGFGYCRNWGSDSYYGVSVSSPTWVLSLIEKLGGLRVVHFAEQGWSKNHDVYACVPVQTWQTRPQTVSTYQYLKHQLREVRETHRRAA
jgi:SAM-dependent methyltransferase